MLFKPWDFLSLNLVRFGLGVSYIWTTLLITAHRCRSKQIFGGAKDFCLNFPKLARTVVVRLLPKNFLPQRLLRYFLEWTPKNGLNLFFCKLWAPFFEVKQRWSPFLSGLSGILPRYSGILPKFLTNQNFWECACTPPPTPLLPSTPSLLLLFRFT